MSSKWTSVFYMLIHIFKTSDRCRKLKISHENTGLEVGFENKDVKNENRTASK